MAAPVTSIFENQRGGVVEATHAQLLDPVTTVTGCGDARRRSALRSFDIFASGASGNPRLAPIEIHAVDVMSHTLHSVAPTDDIHAALKLMRRQKVHRLPVLDDEEKLAGILSLNDVALEAHPIGSKAPAPNYEDLVGTLKALCEHRQLLGKSLQVAASA